jgi:hypothetical protein
MKTQTRIGWIFATCFGIRTGHKLELGSKFHLCSELELEFLKNKLEEQGANHRVIES